ncbi:MAG: hypothetical protein JWR40_2109, partial [Massilia sp.]|nr:hypothetical protein [Massilia sp.]
HTSIVLACLASLNLNYSNRPVRTRMPGGVAGEQPSWLPPMPMQGGRTAAFVLQQITFQ